MDILSLLVVAAVVGLVVWLLTTYIPMPQPIRVVIIAVAAIALLVYLLRALGLGI